MMMDADIRKNCITIRDGWKMGKADMYDALADILDTDLIANDWNWDKVSDVWKRSMRSMKAEWMVHNFLYTHGWFTERTKDVDLDYPCDKPEWLYMAAAFAVSPWVR